VFRLTVRRAVAFTQFRDEEGVEVPDARRESALRFHSTYTAPIAATAVTRFFRLPVALAAIHLGFIAWRYCRGCPAATPERLHNTLRCWLPGSSWAILAPLGRPLGDVHLILSNVHRQPPWPPEALHLCKSLYRCEVSTVCALLQTNHLEHERW
jgi:hypothetical protein